MTQSKNFGIYNARLCFYTLMRLPSFLLGDALDRLFPPKSATVHGFFVWKYVNQISLNP
jgi:hypothetical protein